MEWNEITHNSLHTCFDNSLLVKKKKRELMDWDPRLLGREKFWPLIIVTLTGLFEV